MSRDQAGAGDGERVLTPDPFASCPPPFIAKGLHQRHPRCAMLDTHPVLEACLKNASLEARGHDMECVVSVPTNALVL